MERPSAAEYLVLRKAIAARGALRSALALAGLGAWALVLTAVLAWLPYPIAAIVPLALLLATFEVIRPLHVGAERIGRYLQVFYEEAGDPARPLAETPAWERTAMAISTVPGAGGHPLFVPVFFLAACANLLPLLVTSPAAVIAEVVSVAVPHAAFIAWLAIADRAMRTQRAAELEQFRAMRNGKGRPG